MHMYRSVLQVPFERAVQFPKRYEETDPAVAGSPLLKKQGQQLLHVIVQDSPCSHIAPQQAAHHVAASSAAAHTLPEAHNDMKQRFRELADAIERCSSRIFYDLKARLRNDRSFCDTAGVPSEVLEGSALKTVISEGLRGSTGWNSRARVAVVRMLLYYEKCILFAQLGALSSVRCIVISSAVNFDTWRV